MTMSDKDALFANPLAKVNDFAFNQAVVDVFPDMIQRSVPGYESIISQTGLLAARYVQPQSRIYDLGSSLGATSIAMQASLMHCDASRTTGCEIHGIDNSAAMIKTCESVIAQHKPIGPNPPVPVVLHEDDLENHPMENASVVAMNFTLQFVKPPARQALMDKLCNSLHSGGALILSEKVSFADNEVNRLHIDLYHDYKRANGYSDLEIAQKRTALENVLIPDTLSEHQQRLQAAGFEYSTVWFQCFNFASIVAVKK